ncbi:MAG: hypothetical protein E5V92_07245 [Mesorhizobium sp.]|uniref:hypothetical protein n=1 Tax=Mesorhizobium sp. M1D.F.Ca.ET.043.01.1.1 TaxID=2493669 RepID=UPI000F74D85D|nr:hypothetical protein [Mesorhizobium sp. M1D.F.Ca.ET.043.01.1.1]AZO69935.1 hypothetical protein EJ067_01110 [Mesorhizobium sp. M1D.F.Ca.ET.043.01.1.1]RWE04485.1 MAG: hypothetical protein EOS61_25705 [Mesorhizobium sp.]TJW87986.1 MAG: hypothetical protein E5V92_07245 [Mesorhizobium sp.]
MQSPRKTAADDVKDFTEAPRRTIQFPADLQPVSAAGGAPANINLLHAPSIWACNAPAQESRGLHDKFTAPCKACRPGLLFIALCDKGARKCLLPVPFVAEW